MKEQGAFFLPRNWLLIACLDGLAQAVSFAPGLGPDVARPFDVLRAGLLSNDVFRAKVPKLLARDFMPEPPISHVTKEIPTLELAQQMEQGGLTCCSADRTGR